MRRRGTSARRRRVRYPAAVRIGLALATPRLKSPRRILGRGRAVRTSSSPRSWSGASGGWPFNRAGWFCRCVTATVTPAVGNSTRARIAPRGSRSARAHERHELDVVDRRTREQRVAVPPTGSGPDDGAVHELVAELLGDERRLIAERGAAAPVVDFLQTDEVGVELGARLDERGMVDGAVDPRASA